MPPWCFPQLLCKLPSLPVRNGLVGILKDSSDGAPEDETLEEAFAEERTLELDGRVVGNVMYTKSTLVDEAGKEKGILTFGPVCIRPGLQRRGYGRLLMEESFRRASAMGYEAIVIFGDPNNYVGRGFQSCKKHRVHLEDGTYPAAMLVKELEPGTLAGKSWIYRQSPAFVFDEAEARRFDDSLPPMEKKRLPCQEAFEILSSAVLL